MLLALRLTAKYIRVVFMLVIIKTIMPTKKAISLQFILFLPQFLYITLY